MEKDWVKIYTSPDEHKIALVKAVLDDHLMEIVEINRKDSSYPGFGEVELYIHKNDFDKAIEIIISNEL